MYYAWLEVNDRIADEHAIVIHIQIDDIISTHAFLFFSVIFSKNRRKGDEFGKIDEFGEGDEVLCPNFF